MLVLSRRPGESIVIGDGIVVTIVSVHQDQVRVGIAAPREVQVHRSEVLEAIQAANRNASSPAPADLRRLSRLMRKAPDAPTRQGVPEGTDTGGSSGTGTGGSSGSGTAAP